MIILRLFLEFLKIGMFSVGGGMATLPFLYDLSDKTGWFTHGQIADMLAVSESTPGPIGINMATYVGYTVGGVPGAFVATMGIIIPGFLLVMLVMSMIAKFRESKLVSGAFYGLRPASVGLIVAAGLLVAKLTFLASEIPGQEIAEPIFLGLKVKALILAAILLVMTRFIPKVKDLHPVLFIILSAVVGIAFNFAN